MRNHSSLVVALLLIALGGIGVGLAQLGFSEKGIEFSDGSFQRSAAEPQGEFIQETVTVNIQDFDFCGTADLYTVPFGKELRIEWVSVEVRAFSLGQFPVDVDIRPWFADTQAFIALARLQDGENIGESIFITDSWTSPVTIYSQGGETAQISACRDGVTDLSTSVDVNINGRLFDE